MFDVTRVSARSSDGLDSLCVCDGRKHYLVQMPERSYRGEKPFVYSHNACDGSCQNTDIRDEIIGELLKFTEERFNDGSVVMNTQVVVPEEVFTLLEQPELLGRKIRTWYAKRNGSGTAYRLSDGQVLTISTQYDWARGCETGFYQTVEVRLEYEHASERLCLYLNPGDDALADQAVRVYKVQGLSSCSL